MNALQSIRDVGCGYYNEIPKDTLQTVAKSAFYSFTITFLMIRKPGVSVDLSRPLENSGIAALASFIYSLTTPIFNYAFGDNQIVFHREAIKQIVNCSLTAIAYSYLTTSKVNLIADALFFKLLSFNFCKAGLDFYASALDWWVPGPGQMLKQFYRRFGVQVEPGTGSVFLLP